MSKAKSKKEQFMELYEEHSDAIYRHCFFRTYSKEKAQEFTQETFLRAWNYIRDKRDIANMKALLYRIATNLCIDEYRKKREDSLDRLMEDAHMPEPSNRSHEDMQTGVLLAQVKDVMSTMAEETQQLLIMRYIDDMDPKEIAKVLNISPNYVSVKLHRAVQELKGLIINEA